LSGKAKLKKKVKRHVSKSKTHDVISDDDEEEEELSLPDTEQVCQYPFESEKLAQ
jgi:hypothetical protein